MADSRCFVQFSHPGREHKPDRVGGKVGPSRSDSDLKCPLGSGVPEAGVLAWPGWRGARPVAGADSGSCGRTLASGPRRTGTITRPRCGSGSVGRRGSGSASDWRLPRVHLPRLSCVCRGPVDVLVSWTRGRSSFVGTLTLSDLAPHLPEPEGQSTMLAGAFSPDRSAGGVCGAMRSRSSCGVQHGEHGCHGLTNAFSINDLPCITGDRNGSLVADAHR